MKYLTFLLGLIAALAASGCAGRSSRGAAFYDEYDAVQIDHMVGNRVDQALFEKVVVCLNARREARKVTALTNQIITSVTNQLVSGITNLTVSVSTNLVYTLMTNLAPGNAPLTLHGLGDAPPPGAETNAPADTAALANLSTNFTISLANNASAIVSPSQRTANNQQVRTLNNQLTTSSNNLTVAAMTNLVVTAETNQVITFVTNTSIVSVTNILVMPTNGVAYDYFLYSEITVPQDFTASSGENLVLLVDGARHGFSPTPSTTAFVARKGFTSALYRTSPEVMVAIANARQVRMRFKGTSSVIERTMSSASRQHFRDFLTRYFIPEGENSGRSSASAPAPRAATVVQR